MRRRLTRREKSKRNKQVIMVSTICLLIIMGVGYAAFNTSLTLKAKGNIKNKFVDITENVVTEGDGLYKDIYEEGKYIYKGTNPNNYIEFNNELWRIISKETDGTYKIIRNEIVKYSYWSYDAKCSYSDGFFPAPSAYPGCNKWTEPALLNDYLNSEYYNSLPLGTQNLIVNHNFEIGTITDNNDLQDQISDEKSNLWEGKVGLITVSEYLKANSNQTSCGTFNTNNSNSAICKNTNWLFNNANFWTISASGVGDDNTTTYYIKTDGTVKGGNVAGGSGVTGGGVVVESDTSTESENTNNDKYGVRPSLYLSSDITLSGSGTSQDPYIITN